MLLPFAWMRRKSKA
ncbi:hypothetical protein L1D40_06595 [Shewanella insulae]|nr:hypothetical protein [Shewanella insulae]